MNQVSFCVPFKDGETLQEWRASLPQKGIEVVACKTYVEPSLEQKEFNVVGKTEGMIVLEAKYPSIEKDFDFAELRNFIDSHASCDWIIHMDSDERLATPHAEFWEIIYTLKSSSADAAYLSIAGITTEEKIAGPCRKRYNLPSMRIHKRSAGLKWKGICHETLCIQGVELDVADTDILLYHKGYAIDQEDMIEKTERNARLLIREYTRENSERNWNYLINTFNLIHKLTR